MKIDLEKGLLHVDEHGDVILYNHDFHGEVNLGNIDYDGNYEVPFWLGDAESFQEEIKAALIEQYFGERPAYQERSQHEWSEHILQFLDVDSKQDMSCADFEKISNDGSSQRSEQGRYRDGEGQSLHGLYQNLEGDFCQQVLFAHGKKVLDMRFPVLEKLFECSVLDQDNLKFRQGCEWFDEKGDKVNLGQQIFERVLESKRPMGVMTVLQSSTVEYCLAQAEQRGAGLQVFRHASEEEKFRIFVYRQEALKELLKLDELKEACETMLSCYEKEHGETFASHKALILSKHDVLCSLNAEDALSYMQLDEHADQGDRYLSLLLSGIPLANALALTNPDF